MSLLIHLPLNGNLKNYGLRQDITFDFHNYDENIFIDDNGKIGQCYRRYKNTKDCIRSSQTILLENDFSMCCWCKATYYGHLTSANGIITNHDHNHKAGAGINIYCASETDFRISCSTGDGMSRTYMDYYGSTNIKDAWHHLCLTYDNTNGIVKLYVDGTVEKTIPYYMATVDTYFDLFNWSTGYAHQSSYRPACSLNDVRLYDHCLSAKEVQEISNSLLLHYKLTDTFHSSIIPDCSGHEHNGELKTVTTDYETSFHYTNALKLSSNYISTNLLADVENISVSLWVNCGDVPSDNKVVFADQRSKLAFGFYNDGSAIISCSDGTHKTSVCTGVKIYWKKNQWNHIVVIKHKDAFACYINGHMLSTSASSTNYWTHVKENELTIGCRNNGSYTTYYNGLINDFRYYTTTLTEEQILTLYHTPISVDKNGILYSYELLEEANKVSSLAANGNVATDTFTNTEHNNKLQIFKNAVQATDFIEH